TCLHAVYNYYHDIISIEEVVRQVQQLKSGGTLGVMLGTHALQRGYDVTIYTYNLQIFDPSWFADPKTDLPRKLAEQMLHKNSQRIVFASRAYIEYLNL